MKRKSKKNKEGLNERENRRKKRNKEKEKKRKKNLNRCWNKRREEHPEGEIKAFNVYETYISILLQFSH